MQPVQDALHRPRPADQQGGGAGRVQVVAAKWGCAERCVCCAHAVPAALGPPSSLVRPPSLCRPSKDGTAARTCSAMCECSTADRGGCASWLLIRPACVRTSSPPPEPPPPPPLPAPQRERDAGPARGPHAHHRPAHRVRHLLHHLQLRAGLEVRGAGQEEGDEGVHLCCVLAACWHVGTQPASVV